MQPYPIQDTDSFESLLGTVKAGFPSPADDFREGYAYKKGGVVFTRIEQEGAHVGSLFSNQADATVLGVFL